MIRKRPRKYTWHHWTLRLWIRQIPSCWIYCKRQIRKVYMDSTFDCQSNLMDWLFLLCKMVTLSLREVIKVICCWLLENKICCIFHLQNKRRVFAKQIIFPNATFRCYFWAISVFFRTFALWILLLTREIPVQVQKVCLNTLLHVSELFFESSKD